MAASGIQHLTKHMMQLVGFRRGIPGLHLLTADEGPQSTYHTDFAPFFFQNLFYHVSDGGLSLRPCQSYHRHLFRRMTEPPG